MKIPERPRQLVAALFPFALFGILYDLLRFIPPDFVGKVWIGEPYEWEGKLFGIDQNGLLLLPHQWIRRFASLPLDLYAGFVYSLHILVPVFFTLYLWLRKNPEVKRYAYAFLMVNLLSFVTYVLFPVAPPWYVDLYGSAFHPKVVGNAAGLVAVDQWLAFPYFQSLYAKSAWVFGAIPSMHAGFPLLTLFFVRRIWRGRLLLQVPFLLFMFSVWFAAVYLQQHYVIDIVAGIIYAIAVFTVISCFLQQKVM